MSSEEKKILNNSLYVKDRALRLLNEQPFEVLLASGTIAYTLGRGYVNWRHVVVPYSERQWALRQGFFYLQKPNPPATVKSTILVAAACSWLLDRLRSVS